ncbi:dockerin type I repeat-containing protein [Candidatus Microgenomates bacterium]|nr:dockerin type I repeat-containing protein [Candidatus Microgenomates bacterium]
MFTKLASIIFIVFLFLTIPSNIAVAFETGSVPTAAGNITCDLHNITDPGKCPTPEEWTDGKAVVCCSENDDIAYIRGNMPLVLSNPHGGYSNPTDIPNRTESKCGSDFDTWHDRRSQEYTREVRKLINEATGKYPHVILNRLERIKLDANRSKSQGACGDSRAGLAWERFNSFIDFALAEVTNRCGKGLYTDFHTMGYNNGWIQLGYLLSSGTFFDSDNQLEDSAHINASSVRNLVNSTSATLSEVLRGVNSIGGRLNHYGFDKVFPSQKYLTPPSWDMYFNGGYNTSTNGSKNGGTIDGFQVEVYQSLINEDCDNCNREKLSRALSSSIMDFLIYFYKFNLASSYGCAAAKITPSPTPKANPTPTLTPTPSSCPLKSLGDFNCDGKINESDLNALLNSWLTGGKDLTGDGTVNESDLNKLLGNWKTN